MLRENPYEPLVLNLFVKKVNKRLVIVDGHDKIFYTMPNFIRIHSRKDLEELCEHLKHRGRDIKTIMSFESKFRHEV